MDIGALKVQYPEVNFWMFVGRSGGKRIKGQMFPRGVAVPVWDRKTQLLLKRLPYMKKVAEADLPGMPAKKGAPKAEAKATEIPADWKELHWKRRVSLARQVSNQDVLTPAQADEILKAAAPTAASPEPAPAAAPVETQAQTPEQGV